MSGDDLMQAWPMGADTCGADGRCNPSIGPFTNLLVGLLRRDTYGTAGMSEIQFHVPRMPRLLRSPSTYTEVWQWLS